MDDKSTVALAAALAAAVAAGLFSLIGTFAGEFLAHRLRRTERAELRVEHRRRAAVTMIHGRIDWSRALLAAAFRLDAAARLGSSQGQEWWDELSESLGRAVPWRGQFIDDPRLVDLLAMLKSETEELSTRLSVALISGPGSFKPDMPHVQKIERLIDEVEDRVVELNW